MERIILLTSSLLLVRTISYLGQGKGASISADFLKGFQGLDTPQVEVMHIG